MNVCKTSQCEMVTPKIGGGGDCPLSITMAPHKMNHLGIIFVNDNSFLTVFPNMFWAIISKQIFEFALHRLCMWASCVHKNVWITFWHAVLVLITGTWHHIITNRIYGVKLFLITLMQGWTNLQASLKGDNIVSGQISLLHKLCIQLNNMTITIKS